MEMHLAAVPFTLESAYGSVTPSTRPEPFDEIIRTAKETKAEDTVRELMEGRES